MQCLWQLGYAAEDIIKSIFQVTKNLDIPEALKLLFIMVCYSKLICNKLKYFVIFRKLEKLINESLTDWVRFCKCPV